MRKSILIIAILVFILIQAGLLYVLKSDPKEDIFGLNKYGNLDKKSPETPRDNPENIEEDNVGISSENVDPGNNSLNNNLSNENISCALMRISYSVKKLPEEGNCMLEIRNLDYDIAGNFIVNMTFSNSLQADSAIISKFLGPRQQDVFEYSANLENASCSYEVIETPEKTIC